MRFVRNLQNFWGQRSILRNWKKLVGYFFSTKAPCGSTQVLQMPEWLLVIPWPGKWGGRVCAAVGHCLSSSPGRWCKWNPSAWAVPVGYCSWSAALPPNCSTGQPYPVPWSTAQGHGKPYTTSFDKSLLPELSYADAATFREKSPSFLSSACSWGSVKAIGYLLFLCLWNMWGQGRSYALGSALPDHAISKKGALQALSVQLEWRKRWISGTWCGAEKNEKLMCSY